MATAHVDSIPIFWGHGTIDPLVTFNEMGKKSADWLVNNLGVKRIPSLKDETSIPVGLSFNSYKDMGHEACEDELKDLRAWLKLVVPEETA